MPSLRLISTTARTDPVPRRCPSVRLLPRSFAQRPLPSMITATWRGSRLSSRPRRFMLRGGYARRSVTGGKDSASDFHDLVFFSLEDLIDFVDELFGHLFDAIF